MAIVMKEMSVAKEVDEVAVLLVELVADLRAKKSPSELLAENLGNLVAALEGMDQIDDEMKANRKVALSTLGHRLGELTDALLG